MYIFVELTTANAYAQNAIIFTTVRYWPTELCYIVPYHSNIAVFTYSCNSVQGTYTPQLVKEVV